MFCGITANTSAGKEGARCLAVAAESFPRAFTCKFAPLLPLCSHNGARQIIVSSQRDGFHPRALWMCRETGLNSYVELSAAATEPESSSSIMEEGKQPGPFNICANVREKDRSQELTAAEVEEAKKTFSRRNRWTCGASRWLLLHRDTFIRGSSEPSHEDHNETQS